MNVSTETPLSTRIKVGLYAIVGLLLIGAVTVFVNDKPYWWRSCQLVHINVEDGTGLKSKSPVRSLGIEIGYLKTVDLSETHVDLGICITAPVEVLPSTRAYLRGEGFLGDKFVELKPVRYVGPTEAHPTESVAPSPTQGAREGQVVPNGISYFLKRAWDNLAVSVYAEEPTPAPVAKVPAKAQDTTGATTKKGSRQIPVGEQSQDVQHLVNRVDDLVNEMTNLTTNLKSAINPDQLRQTMKQLNVTLENASRTLSPEGGLNQTAQRTLAKLEDAIEQLRDQMTRINKGEGSLGMLLNDPTYAEELHEAIRNVNKFLSKVGNLRFVVDVGGMQINAYGGGRGYFNLQIYPKPDRYYLLGISIDPRGKISQSTTTTNAGGLSTVVETTQLQQSSILLTGMLGKVFQNRLDLSIGALFGDGALSVALRMGPRDREDALIIRNDVYARGSGFGIDDRIWLILRPYANLPVPWAALYASAGIEGFRTTVSNGLTPYFYGAGVTFDDEDIKILFTFL